jgi:hypothetical protein
MARGWESKSVEMQQEERDSVKGPDGKRPGAERERQIESLERSRGRLVFELEATTHPRLQDMKRRAIEHVDAQLAQLRALA